VAPVVITVPEQQRAAAGVAIVSLVIRRAFLSQLLSLLVQAVLVVH
jgi:hypothetical protein